MSAELGVILLILAFFSATYALVASLLGARKNNERLVESARNAAIITWPLLTLAAVLMITLLVRGDFSVAFVWSVTSREMPTYLKVTALWGGQAGSLLLWSWLMSTFAAAAMLRNWRREHHLMPYVIGASMGTLAFFILLVTFWENPFATYFATPAGAVDPALFAPSVVLSGLTAAITSIADKAPGLLGVLLQGVAHFAPPVGSTVLVPPDGKGLNPLLRHIGMIIHPPMLYLGFVSFVVPYAFAMGALARGEVSDAWIRSTRRWTLVAWLFLSLGLILGGRWAYDVLGWGGYWGWDPVENAALMPWLTGTAFLHSVMIQEKRGMLRRWNMLLITFTYLQVILGTFLTRSGVLSSVHAFAQSAIGPLFFLFVAGAFVISISLLIKNWDALGSDNQLENLLSRETFFLVNNLLFVALNIVIAIGTFWPLITELAADYFPTVEKATVGPPWFNGTTGPLWLALLLLMGVAPLIAWHRASAKRLGRALLWPLAITLVGGALMVWQGIRNPLALLGYVLALLAASVTVLEFHRGAMARMKAHGESYPAALWTLVGRNRRRYGGYFIHLGVIIMAIGIISSNVYQQQTQQAVAAGQTITLHDYVLQFDNLETFTATDGRQVTRAQTTVYHNGREVGHLVPRIDNYQTGDRATIPATLTTITGDDLYVLLVAWEPVSYSSATIKIYYNPLINWVWGGGFIFIIGTLIAAWPDYSEERRTVTHLERTPLPAAGD